MIVKHFAIYDKKTLHYSQVFPSQTHGSAERSFKDSVNNPESPHHKYPEDFALYYLFDLDDESGQIVEAHSPPQLVTEASALVS